MGSAIELENVTKVWRSSNGRSTLALDAFDFRFEAGGSYAILGPNGCGKSSLLDLIAGFSALDSGKISFVGATAPRLGFVFQNYRESLIPWLSARENVEWPAKGKGALPDAHARAQRALAFLSQRFDPDKRVSALSGGQAQLVSIARAWAQGPDILLCDEPFSALDILARKELAEVITSFCKAESVTCITISHNVEEALHMANTILVASGPPLAFEAVIRVDADLPRERHFLLSETFKRANFEIENEISKLRENRPAALTLHPHGERLL